MMCIIKYIVYIVYHIYHNIQYLSYYYSTATCERLVARVALPPHRHRSARQLRNPGESCPTERGRPRAKTEGPRPMMIARGPLAKQKIQTKRIWMCRCGRMRRNACETDWFLDIDERASSEVVPGRGRRPHSNKPRVRQPSGPLPSFSRVSNGICYTLCNT